MRLRMAGKMDDTMLERHRGRSEADAGSAERRGRGACAGGRALAVDGVNRPKQREVDKGRAVTSKNVASAGRPRRDPYAACVFA